MLVGSPRSQREATTKLNLVGCEAGNWRLLRGPPVAVGLRQSILSAHIPLLTDRPFLSERGGGMPWGPAARLAPGHGMLGNFCKARSDNYCDRIRCYPDFHLHPPVND